MTNTEEVQERSYSWAECAEMICCPGEWKSLEEWGESLDLSGDDLEYISPEIDESGRVRVSLPMYESLPIWDEIRRTCPECGSKNAYEDLEKGVLVCWCG